MNISLGQTIRTIRIFNTFKQYISGNFSNSNQVKRELKTGKYTHPLAIHVNAEITNKVKNLPTKFKGFFLLEESYYLAAGKPMEIKPYLFHFSPINDTSLQLKVYQFPPQINKEDIRNDNPKLELDFNQLVESPTFKGAVYYWDEKTKSFNTKSTHNLGNGTQFTLIENISANKLEVLELLEKDGVLLTNYTTPIIYERER